MAPKRALESGARGRPRKSPKTVNQTPMVVEVLSKAEALPSDLRTVFEVALPIIFGDKHNEGSNKDDRHAYEAEIVDQAEKSLADAQAAVEKAHAEALAKQNEVIAPAEHARRTAALKAANEGLEAVKAKLEDKKEAHAAAKKAVHDAEKNLKAAEKDSQKTEKEMQALADKKGSLSEILENEFVQLRDGTSLTPEGKQAVKKLTSIGKEYSLDETLISTLPMTCKKDPTTRTEFETMMFTSLKNAIDREIATISDKLGLLEPSKAEKLAAVASAKEEVERLESVQTAAHDEFSAANAASKDAGKEVSKADDYLYKIWKDMKTACDAQDELAAELKNFKDNVVTAFQQLKEKQPAEEEVEEEEAAEEEAEPMEAVAEAETAEATAE